MSLRAVACRGSAAWPSRNGANRAAREIVAHTAPEFFLVNAEAVFDLRWFQACERFGQDLRFKRIAANAKCPRADSHSGVHVHTLRRFTTV
jgi:hypothetical protein